MLPAGRARWRVPRRAGWRVGLGGLAVIFEVEPESILQSTPGLTTTASRWRKITGARTKHSLKECTVILIPLIRWVVRKLRNRQHENLRGRRQAQSR